LQFAGAEYGDLQFPFDGCGSHGNKVFFSSKYKHFFGKTRKNCFFRIENADTHSSRIANSGERGTGRFAPYHRRPHRHPELTIQKEKN